MTDTELPGIKTPSAKASTKILSERSTYAVLKPESHKSRKSYV